jgi:hypothetical protein
MGTQKQSNTPKASRNYVGQLWEWPQLNGNTLQNTLAR